MIQAYISNEGHASIESLLWLVVILCIYWYSAQGLQTQLVARLSCAAPRATCAAPRAICTLLSIYSWLPFLHIAWTEAVCLFRNMLISIESIPFIWTAIMAQRGTKALDLSKGFTETQLRGGVSNDLNLSKGGKRISEDLDWVHESPILPNAVIDHRAYFTCKIWNA